MSLLAGSGLHQAARWLRLQTLVALLSLACSPQPRSMLLGPSERKVVDSLVAVSHGWRLAGDKDVLDTLGLSGMRERDPHFDPYFSKASDGSFAFVMAKGNSFRVEYVRSERRRYSQPTEVASVTWLDSGLIALKGDTLHIAPYASDEIFRFVWDSSSRRIELVEDR